MTNPSVLSPSQRTSALAGLPDWRYWLGSLHTAYDCDSAASALALVAEIGEAAQQHDHHPDIDWRYRHVFLRVSTHSRGNQVTVKDTDIARVISATADSAGARAVPKLCRTIEIAVDTTRPDVLAPAWSSALGYTVDGSGNLADPYHRGPSVWFQETASPDQSRMHIDVEVEDTTADDVLAEAVGRGATRIDDRFRPSFTVLADADGNRICICTNLGRD